MNKGGEVGLKKGRKYYRMCGICGKRYEQKEMKRTAYSKNGWLCKECYESDEYLDFDNNTGDPIGWDFNEW